MKPSWMVPLLVSAGVTAAVSGCDLSQIVTSGGPATTTGSGAGQGGQGGEDGGAPPHGIGCGSDPQTGAILCLGLSLCADILVDISVFPGCGFSVHGNAIDLECVCGDSLCPIGAATSCAAAKQLLATQNQGIVCAQLGDGLCKPVGASSGSASTGSSGCDQTCYSQCGGDPGCIVLCGC